jgi:adenylate kinase family enzyme
LNQVIVVTGPPGAGKSSVAEAICERFDRMMHIEVDHLRHWVKAGYRHPWLDDPQAAEQGVLAVRNASAIAREADALRYAAVIDDVVFASQAALYREAFAGIGGNVHFVLLLPSLEVALARDGQRVETIRDRVRALHEDFTRESAAGLLPGAAIDSSEDGDAALTADRVMDAVASGAALFIEGADST